MARDLRLDVWRGLCLVDVVLVHLAYNGIGFPAPLDALIRDYARFAAGGFVFLSGLTIGVVFAARLGGSWLDRLAVYRWSLRRAAVLLIVDALASLAFQGLDGLREFPVTDGAAIADAARELVLLQRSGISGGILFLYAMLLGALPVILELRRRFGAGAVAAVSVGVYAAAQWSTPLQWPGNQFPIAWWQPLFVAGLLSDEWYRRARHAARRWLLAWTLVAASAVAAVFVLVHGPQLGITIAGSSPSLDFTKTPLRPGALLWYAAIVQLLLAATSLLWRRLLAFPALISCLALLGRHSLLVYVAHVFTEIVVLEYVWKAWPATAARMGAVAADVGALALLCAAVEWRPMAGWYAPPLRAMLRPAVVSAIGLVVAVLVSGTLWPRWAHRFRSPEASTIAEGVHEAVPHADGESEEAVDES